jgi:dihydrolipoamide dehydrogenase
VTKLVKGVEYLMKKNKVTVIAGEARLKQGRQVLVGSDAFEAGQVVLATGSRPDRSALAQLPAQMVIEIDELYARSDLPDRVIVAGGNSVACEMASMLRLVGRTVALVSPSDALVPWLDESVSTFILDKFKRSGIAVYLGKELSGATAGEVQIAGEKLPGDIVINCNDRRAVLPEMESMPLDRRDGFIAVNEFMQTSVPSVYAAGDVTGGFLAHFASAEAVTAVNHIAGIKQPLDYAKIPSVIYMDPEIGTVGLTEEQIKSRGIAYVKGEFPMQVSSKAMVEGETEGFVKVLADQKYGEVLGVHIVASRATDLIAEAVMCMRTEGTLEDLAGAVHPHPTISETFVEAGYKAMGKPLHV